MSKTTSVASILSLGELPASVRRKPFGKLSRADLKLITGMLQVKEWVQQSYKEQSRIMQATIVRKRKAGYCGGFVYCLNYTGKHHMCADCKRQKTKPRYSKRLSPYGQIRKAERAKERQERQSQ